MRAHQCRFFLVERTRLDQDRVGQGEFADVVQQRAHAQILQRAVLDARQPAQPFRHAHDAVGMVAGFLVAHVHRFHQRAQGLFVAFAQPAVGRGQLAYRTADHPVQQHARADHEQPALEILPLGEAIRVAHQRAESGIGKPYP